MIEGPVSMRSFCPEGIPHGDSVRIKVKFAIDSLQ